MTDKWVVCKTKGRYKLLTEAPWHLFTERTWESIKFDTKELADAYKLFIGENKCKSVTMSEYCKRKLGEYCVIPDNITTRKYKRHIERIEY